MLIYLVRHWQTEANINGICSGWTETNLTQTWIKQAQAASQALQSVTFDAVFSSDLSRAYETAAHITWSNENIIQTMFLRERNYHEFEWVHGSILDQYIIDEWFQSTTHFAIQWGKRNTWKIIESNDEMIQRREQFHKEYIIPQHWQAILITSHWSFIRNIIAHVLQLDLSIEWINHYISPLQNTWICIIEYTPEKWVRLVTYNQHTHILTIQ